MKKRRIIVNNDYFNIFQAAPPITDQDVWDAVDKLVAPAAPGSAVDALFLNAPEPLEDAVISPQLEVLYQHPDADQAIACLSRILQSGKDPWKMVLDRARQRGLDLFASFRMNDTHYKDHPYHPWTSQFYYDNLHHRIRKLDDSDTSRFNTEFDYRKSVVRDHYFAWIKHYVETYDLDGVELDMTRNCRFFPAEGRDECAPVMTQFVGQIRAMLDAAGKNRGRKIELAVTLPGSLYHARQEGLDVATWARLGYLDLLCMSSPFLADMDRDIADTIRKVGPGVAVYGGCDRNFAWPARPLPKEAYRALASSYLRQGAAGIYLYNVMHWTMRLNNVSEALKVAGGGSLQICDASLMHELAGLESLARLDKLYLVASGSATPDKALSTLPIEVPAKGEATVKIFVGDDIAHAASQGQIKRITVQSVSPDCGDYNNYTLKLNGTDLARQYAFVPYALKPASRFVFPEPENKQSAVPLENVRRHPARAVDLHLGVNYITIKSWNKAMTISEVELAIEYA